MAAPPSQRYRQIGFFLEGGGGAASPTRFTFGIRPADLTRHEPSRISVQQTLGGAWADVFDRGLSSITISGHNGWRGGIVLSGEELFAALRKTVFTDWHARRAAAIAAGKDPSTVRLYFTDALDQISVLVAPRAFDLRRYRASPLLMHYHIDLVVLDDAGAPTNIIDSIINALSDPLRWLAGVTGLGNVLALVNQYATEAVNVLGAIGGAVRGFINIGTSLIQGVSAAAQQVVGQFQASQAALLSVGSLYCRAASNGFAAVAADDTLQAQYRIPIMAMSSAFNDAACTMGNSFDQGRYFRDFSGLLGASACSSTGGGDPANPYTVAGDNPFKDIVPIAGAPALMTPDAQAAITTLAGDPIPLIGQTAAVGSLMSRAAAGVTLQ